MRKRARAWVAAAAACAGLTAATAAAAQELPDALELYRNGSYQDAVAVTLAELEETPNNLDSIVVLGWSQIALGRFDQALDTAERGLGVARFDHRIIEIAGEALYYQGRLEDALLRFEEYAALAPEGSRIERVYSFMGEIFIQLQEYNNADIAFSTALYLLPNTAAWWARLGYARELAGKHELSMQAYQRALQLEPGFAEAARGQERVRALVAAQ